MTTICTPLRPPRAAVQAGRVSRTSTHGRWPLFGQFIAHDNRANEPGWTPTLPACKERFGLADLLLS
jgi:hypothetical protein